MSRRNKCLQDLAELDQRLDDLQQELSGLPAEQLSLSDGEKWSILEIAEHLYLAEKGSLRYVEYKLNNTPILPKAGFGTLWNNIKLHAGFYLLRKLPAPESVSRPKFVFKNQQELWQAWRQEREALRSFLTKTDDDTFTLVCYKHSLAGRITVSGMMAFFKIHFKRHFKQIKARL